MDMRSGGKDEHGSERLECMFLDGQPMAVILFVF